MHRTRKGFTLIELLIVIAILGVLAAAATIVLNPAELLAQARDGQRISDLDTLRTALNTYLSDTPTIPPNLNAAGFGLGGGCTQLGVPQQYPFNNNSSTTSCTVPTTANLRKVDSNGWVDVNFSGLPGGSPLAVLPVDPTNSTYYLYGYNGGGANYTYKLATHLESAKFVVKEIQFAASTSTIPCTPANGTSQYCWYQVGTNLGL
jgi:prepilin-type N-terminal cleavage/methylation domain-containing protein